MQPAITSSKKCILLPGIRQLTFHEAEERLKQQHAAGQLTNKELFELILYWCRKENLQKNHYLYRKLINFCFRLVKEYKFSAHEIFILLYIAQFSHADFDQLQDIFNYLLQQIALNLQDYKPEDFVKIIIALTKLPVELNTNKDIIKKILIQINLIKNNFKFYELIQILHATVILLYAYQDNKSAIKIQNELICLIKLLMPLVLQDKFKKYYIEINKTQLWIALAAIHDGLLKDNFHFSETDWYKGAEWEKDKYYSQLVKITVESKSETNSQLEKLLEPLSKHTPVQNYKVGPFEIRFAFEKEKIGFQISKGYCYKHQAYKITEPILVDEFSDALLEKRGWKIYRLSSTAINNPKLILLIQNLLKNHNTPEAIIADRELNRFLTDLQLFPYPNKPLLVPILKMA